MKNMIARFPWRQGNRFDFLVDASSFLPRMISAIDGARHYVLLEMYLIESGKVVERFINAIRQAAQRGVPVYILLDDYGAIGLKQAERDALLLPNIHVTYYNVLRSHSTLYNLYRIFLRHSSRGLYRNHRKLLVVDGIRAFVGGTGLTDEFDPPQQTVKQWRETMVEIQGPVLQDWQRLFLQSWGDNPAPDVTIPLAAPGETLNGQLGRVSVGRAQHHSEILQSLNTQIHNAKKRIWFATAYFVPPRRLRKALNRAARNGVDVRILVPGPITDHPGVRYAGQRHYGRLLRNGVRIFEYQPRFFHAKTVLCDDWITIGSSNFDRWNLRWNLEANQEVKDERLATMVETMFAADFGDSAEVHFKNWLQRGWFSRLRQWFWRIVERFSLTIGR